MDVRPILQTWGRALIGRVPSLSIEITKECPLRCPGCYAYEDAHLGTTNLRSLSDFRNQELIDRVLGLVDQYQPLHLSIVGGDPLVRYRELDALLPLLAYRGIHVQVVTSAFRPISPSWVDLPRLRICVSVDGLQPDHDLRRAPATYQRILKNIQGQHVTIHCTVTSAMVKRDDYVPEFLDFWSANPSTDKIWFSIFTPQRGANNPECLTDEERRNLIESLLAMRHEYPKLDMGEAVLREYLSPPSSPDKCIFAKTTRTISADFKTQVEPCQFGGDPDCSRCGCFASMGLAAIGHHKLVGSLTAGDVFHASAALGRTAQRVENALVQLFAGRSDRTDEQAPDSEMSDSKLTVIS